MKKICLYFLLIPIFCLSQNPAKINHTVISLTSNQIRNLYSAPIDIGINLSPNETVEIITMCCDWHGNSTPYTSLFLYIWTEFAPSFQLFDNAALLLPGIDKFIYFTNSGFSSNALVKGQHVFIRSDSDSFTGDGTGVFYITYRILGSNDQPELKDTIVTLTSSQILNLFSTPITLIPAPGSNKSIEVLSATAKLNFNSIAYLGHTSLSLIIGTANSTIASTGIVTQGSNVKWLMPVSSPNGTTQLIENQPLIAISDLANFTTGNSTVTLHIYYRIEDY